MTSQLGCIVWAAYREWGEVSNYARSGFDMLQPEHRSQYPRFQEQLQQTSTGGYLLLIYVTLYRRYWWKCTDFKNWRKNWVLIVLPPQNSLFITTRSPHNIHGHFYDTLYIIIWGLFTLVQVHFGGNVSFSTNWHFCIFYRLYMLNRTF